MPSWCGAIRTSLARLAPRARKSWLSVKEKERKARGETGDSSSGGPVPTAPGSPPASLPSLLDGIPRTLPSTLEAFEIGTRVAEVGFDWAKVGDVLDKIEEEVRELRQELKDQGLEDVGTPRDYVPRDSARIEEEVGDLLFTAANLARYLRSDPE